MADPDSHARLLPSPALLSGYIVPAQTNTLLRLCDAGRAFDLAHYAAEVRYDIRGWVSKVLP